MSKDNATILVTGGTGFVGSHLVDRLVEQGHSVRCLVRSTSNLKYLKQPGVEFAYGGLDSDTDWDPAFKDVDTVYHVAGLTFARRARDYFAVNHKGTENVLGAALKRRNQLKRFVHISSLAAIGPARDEDAVTETTPPRPITPYGRSKLAGEEALRMVRDLLDYTIVRPPAVYGPRDYAILEIFKAVKRGMSPVIGPHDMKFSIVHVSDLVDGIILAAHTDAARGRSYFISSERIYSIREVNEILMRIIGKQARIMSIPRPIAYGVALLAEGAAAITGKMPVINRDKVRDFSQRSWACSIDAAKKDLGFRDRTPLEEGLKATYDWYKKEGWL